MSLALIIAVDQDGVYGIDGKLPWEHAGISLKADMSRFRSLTMGCPVIMGKETYESIIKNLPSDKNPLPGRRILVVTSTGKLPGINVRCCKTFKRALEIADEGFYSGKVFAIGGSRIWTEAVENRASEIYVTVVEESFSKDITDNRETRVKSYPGVLDVEGRLPFKEESRKKVIAESVPYDLITYRRNSY